jgi:hypothetical protein
VVFLPRRDFPSPHRGEGQGEGAPNLPNPLVILLLLVSLAGCTHVVWYGHSDDRHHIVSVLEQGNTQHVRLDMIDGPPVKGVGVDALVLDGTHLTYPAQVDDGWLVMHDGVRGRSYDALGELVVREPHVAYTAQRNARWLVVHDGIETESFENILPSSLTLVGNHLAFAAQNGAAVFAVIDGKKSPPLDGLGQLRFSTDGAHSGFVARKNGDTFLMLDGVEGPHFDNLADLELGPPLLYVAKAGRTWRVFTDGQPGPEFERVAGLRPDGAYVGRLAGAEWVLDGVRKSGPFTALKSTLARDPTGQLVFLAKHDGAFWLVHGDTELGPFHDVEGLVIEGAHVGFIGERDGRSVIVIDGVERSRWDWAGSLALSATGRVAHLAKRDEQTVLIVDGVEKRIEVVVSGTLAFSRDGTRFGCVTGERAKKRLFITRDDGTRSPIDIEELAAALSRSPPESLLLSPDVTLLRRWVAAELE